MSKNNQFKIFQIGFNKCGTRSIHHFFEKNGIKSIHYDKGRLAKTILIRNYNNKLLLDNKYNKYTVFTDMENIRSNMFPIYIPQLFFKKLYYQYPNSKFILNIRNKQKWLKSRCAHRNGNYLKIISNKLKKTEEEVVLHWSNEWDIHINNVKLFFTKKPGKLLIFDIENDDIQKLINFFRNDFNLDEQHYIHKGKSII